MMPIGPMNAAEPIPARAARIVGLMGLPAELVPILAAFLSCYRNLDEAAAANVVETSSDDIA